jgi:NAD(P)-dependent dehydrogenase (short-subunit alcohol dehydrogenase family)
MGPVSDLALADIERAFAMKAIGPLLIAKYLGAELPAGGSMTFLSGYVAWKPRRGMAVMAAANGALAFLAPALAVELGPVRVNVVSPGVIDSGMWDGPDKERFLIDHAESTPLSWIGHPDDIASAVLFLMSNTFVTGAVLHVDGGARYS